ncbi:MAG: Hsp20/alpha crystallin family protein [Acidobacteria bacterium]|nr:Hsp20/alpha crystallin family protein [Acidobacteriota bacterium]
MSNREELIRKFQELQDRIHTLMEDAVAGPQTPGAGLPTHCSPAVDVFETAEEFVLTAELPGVERKGIDLQVKDHTLLLKGQRNPGCEVSQQVYYRLERPSGVFERRFSLPEDIEADKIRAHLNEGVLTVTLPKKQRRRQVRRVEVKKG